MIQARHKRLFGRGGGGYGSDTGGGRMPFHAPGIPQQTRDVGYAPTPAPKPTPPPVLAKAVDKTIIHGDQKDNADRNTFGYSSLSDLGDGYKKTLNNQLTDPLQTENKVKAIKEQPLMAQTVKNTANTFKTGLDLIALGTEIAAPEYSVPLALITSAGEKPKDVAINVAEAIPGSVLGVEGKLAEVAGASTKAGKTAARLSKAAIAGEVANETVQNIKQGDSAGSVILDTGLSAAEHASGTSKIAKTLRVAAPLAKIARASTKKVKTPEPELFEESEEEEETVVLPDGLTAAEEKVQIFMMQNEEHKFNDDQLEKIHQLQAKHPDLIVPWQIQWQVNDYVRQSRTRPESFSSVALPEKTVSQAKEDSHIEQKVSYYRGLEKHPEKAKKDLTPHQVQEIQTLVKNKQYIPKPHMKKIIQQKSKEFEKIPKIQPGGTILDNVERNEKVDKKRKPSVVLDNSPGLIDSCKFIKDSKKREKCKKKQQKVGIIY